MHLISLAPIVVRCNDINPFPGQYYVFATNGFSLEMDSGLCQLAEATSRKRILATICELF